MAYASSICAVARCNDAPFQRPARFNNSYNTPPYLMAIKIPLTFSAPDRVLPI